MRIPPLCKVPVLYVHSAGVADASVNHNNLPVVAVVEAGDDAKRMEARVVEAHQFYAGLAHFVVKAALGVVVGYVFMQYAHFYALAGLLHKRLLHGLSADVVAKQIILEVDVFLCVFNILQKGRQLSFADGDNLYVIPCAYAGQAV